MSQSKTQLIKLRATRDNSVVQRQEDLFFLFHVISSATRGYRFFSFFFSPVVFKSVCSVTNCNITIPLYFLFFYLK